MFAKLAQVRLRPARVVSAPDIYRIGRRAACRPTMAASHRARRPMLVCRWRHAPATGALECMWESVDAPAASQPRSQRSPGEVHRLTDARAAARRPFRRSAA
jgi:hypothetical protein